METRKEKARALGVSFGGYEPPLRPGEARIFGAESARHSDAQAKDGAEKCVTPLADEGVKILRLLTRAAQHTIDGFERS